MKITDEININKAIIKHSVLLIFFIILVFLFTLLFLKINMVERGNIEVINDFYNIYINEVTIDYNTTTKAIINDSYISFNIDDLYNYEEAKTVMVELYNIGNKDATIEEVLIDFTSSNIDNEYMIINVSLKKDDIIRAKSKKRFEIKIQYNSPNILKTDVVDFNVEFLYK